MGYQRAEDKMLGSSLIVALGSRPASRVCAVRELFVLVGVNEHCHNPVALCHIPGKQREITCLGPAFDMRLPIFNTVVDALRYGYIV